MTQGIRLDFSPIASVYNISTGYNVNGPFISYIDNFYGTYIDITGSTIDNFTGTTIYVKVDCDTCEDEIFTVHLATPTPTPTPTNTPTATPTPTNTPTPTSTPTPTDTPTPTPTNTPTSTPTITPTPTVITNYGISLNGTCSGVYSTYTITGGTYGDIVVVKGLMGGLIAGGGISGYATRSDLTVDGVSVSSPCYSDSSTHGYNINASSTFMMSGSTRTFSVAAVTNNSSSSMSSLGIKIISINGNPVDITISGCVGNSSGSITC